MANALAPKVNHMAAGNALAGRGGELRAWQPGVMDNVRNYAMNVLAPLFGGDVRAANAYYRDKIQPTAEFLPGVGDVMAAGEAKDAFSQGDYLGGGLLAAGAMAGLVPGVGDAVQRGAKQAAKGIRAYHGSPHDFDKFSMDKIGTGEGAQAYGHGLYFAEQEGTAKAYRDALSGDTHPTAKGLMFKAGGDKAAALDALERDLRGHAPDSHVDELRKEIEEYGNPRGRMYEVNINANPDDFLDWDKPLSEQPESVRNAFIKAKNPSDDPLLAELLDTSPEGMLVQGMVPEAKGSAAYKTMADDIGGDDKAREALRQAGIPGIKYLDAGSRSAGDGSRNYVVFDDSLIEILRKYGVVPATVGTGAFMQMMQDDPERAQELHTFATSMRDGA